jgi:hypothetical protein
MENSGREKEGNICCGSQYRFVVDFVPGHLPEDLLELAAGIKKRRHQRQESLRNFLP